MMFSGVISDAFITLFSLAQRLDSVLDILKKEREKGELSIGVQGKFT